MGGGGDTTTTQVLPPVQQAGQDVLTNRAVANAQQPLPFFPGQTVAPFDPATAQAQSNIVGTAAPAAQGIADQLASAQNRVLSGELLFPESNPALQQVIEGAIRDINQNLTEVQLPSIRRGATATRSIGGSRQGIAEGIALRGASDAVGDTSAGIRTTGFLSGLDALTRGLTTAPGSIQAQAGPASLLDAVGIQRRDLNQAQLNAGRERFEFERDAEAIQLERLAGFLPGGAGGTTTQQGGRGASQARTTLGLAATGASIGTAIYPGIGSAVGAGIGALASFFV